MNSEYYCLKVMSCPCKVMQSLLEKGKYDFWFLYVKFALMEFLFGVEIHFAETKSLLAFRSKFIIVL